MLVHHSTVTEAYSHSSVFTFFFFFFCTVKIMAESTKKIKRKDGGCEKEKTRDQARNQTRVNLHKVRKMA